MIRRTRRLAFSTVLLASVFGPTALVVTHCAPAEDTSVTVVRDCNESTLNQQDTAEETIKLYLDEANELRDRSKELLDRFTTICNAINKDLGEPEGADVHAACNKIADHIQAAQAKAPPGANGASPPQWVQIQFDTTCNIDGASAARCLDLCSDQKGCDASGSCPTALVGHCNGNCPLCLTPATGSTCNGQCRGACAFPDYDGGAAEAGAPACQGECVGKCNAPTWQGSCSTGCRAAFRGVCKGTCTGSCDGVAYDGGPPPPFDAGNPDSGDAEAGAPDAGPPDAAGPPGSGNCAGLCTGACDGEASGSCGALPGSASPCKGDFFGGQCGGVGNCIGTCTGSGVACITTCQGACVTPSGNCGGTCLQCKGTVDQGACGAVPTCDNPNPICKGVCALRGALDAKCTPTAANTLVAGDYALANALRPHMADFTKAARDAAVLNGNLGGVLGRAEGQFLQIGAVHDNARACANGAAPIYDEARLNLNQAVGASLVMTGQKF